MNQIESNQRKIEWLSVLNWHKTNANKLTTAQQSVRQIFFAIKNHSKITHLIYNIFLFFYKLYVNFFLFYISLSLCQGMWTSISFLYQKMMIASLYRVWTVARKNILYEGFRFLGQKSSKKAKKRITIKKAINSSINTHIK
jgi:hypothetical protein